MSVFAVFDLMSQSRNGGFKEDRNGVASFRIVTGLDCFATEVDHFEEIWVNEKRALFGQFKVLHPTLEGR